MERREQYDPEDIESLLQERSFDELLEEERAYVLRHLSGREEYEQMRALLRHVREDDRRHAPIEADDHVRANVIQAFRAQQQPQWRVWLNSIGGIFTPGEGYAMWRPALALGMLVVLFGIGIWLITGPLAGPTNDQLAEVRRQKAEEPLPVKKPETGDTTQVLQREGSANAEMNEVKAEANAASADQQQSETVFSNEGSAAFQPTMGSTEIAEDAAKDANVPAELEIEGTAVADDAQFHAPASGSHVVTQEELIMNQSVANATGKVQTQSVETKAARAKAPSSLDGSGRTDATMSRSVAEDPQVLELLSAGW